MPKKLLAFVILFETLATIILSVWSAYELYLGNDLRAIYFILGAIYMGRGQVVRATARETREELEAMERGE
jgi:hypothetical protein